MGELNNWRGCNNCGALFFDGFPEKGTCPARAGGHVANSFNFVLTNDVPASATGQAEWRGCDKCSGMFFDGFDEKGVCPAGGEHHRHSANYVLPHDVPASLTAQPDWRGCNNCGVIFFDGFDDNKGVCPAGGGHVQNSFNFVLPHPVHPVIFLRDGWPNDATEVFVFGRGFSPYNRVSIHCSYQDGAAKGWRDPIETDTDVNGEFERVAVPVSPSYYNIEAKGVDAATGQEVSSPILRESVA